MQIKRAACTILYYSILQTFLISGFIFAVLDKRRHVIMYPKFNNHNKARRVGRKTPHQLDTLICAFLSSSSGFFVNLKVMLDKKENQMAGEITAEQALNKKALLNEAVRRYNIIQTYLLNPPGQLKETMACLTILLLQAMDHVNENESLTLHEVKQLLKLYHLLNEAG